MRPKPTISKSPERRIPCPIVSGNNEESVDIQKIIDKFGYSFLSRPNPRNDIERLSCQEAIDEHLDEKIVLARKCKYICGRSICVVCELYITFIASNGSSLKKSLLIHLGYSRTNKSILDALQPYLIKKS